MLRKKRGKYNNIEKKSTVRYILEIYIGKKYHNTEVQKYKESEKMRWGEK